MVYSWGPEGPPSEAYGRVTDAERFRPLHDLGRAVLAELEAHFVVARSAVAASSGSDDGILLTPLDAAASPLTMFFTPFPGLKLRMGAAVSLVLPTCGCDACSEDVEDCVEHLERWIPALVGGGIVERFRHRTGHGWWYGKATRGLDSSSFSGVDIEGTQVAELQSLLPTGEQRWAPWPRRPDALGQPSWPWTV